MDLAGLVERSRRIGADRQLVVHGGGNTSSKGCEHDWRDRPRPVLRVKGSGTDLATIGPDGFPGVYLDELDVLRERAEMTDEDMVGYLAHCMREPGGRFPSIETLLHAWLPARHVDHTHADAICALSNHADGAAAIAEALGPDVAIVPYVRPGFELSKRVAELADAEAIVLDHHGLVTWGETHEASLEGTVELDRRARAYLAAHGGDAPQPERTRLGERDAAQLLVALREALAPEGQPVVLHVDRRQHGLADRADVRTLARAARSTPDHILRIGPWSLVATSAADVVEEVARFERDYRAYFERHASRLPAGLSMHAPVPRIVLVPGLGCVAAAATSAAAQANAELALHSHGVTARVLDAFGAVSWLDEAETFDFDYWPLELRKLARAGSSPRLQGRIVVLRAPADGRGGVTDRLRAEGATVVEGVRDAVLSHGGADALIATAEALDAELEHARELGVEPPASVAVVGTTAQRTGVCVVDSPLEAPATAECIALLASASGPALRGSTLRAAT